MENINYLAVIVLTLAGFIFSSIYYVITAKPRAEFSEAGKQDLANMKQPDPRKMLIEIIRTFILVWVLAYLVQHTGTTSMGSGAKLGMIFWIGFPLLLLSGSVMWEKVPAKLAAIHAGDWFVKVVITTLVLAVWH